MKIEMYTHLKNIVFTVTNETDKTVLLTVVKNKKFEMPHFIAARSVCCKKNNTPKWFKNDEKYGCYR